jgi:hypothetical protein
MCKQVVLCLLSQVYIIAHVPVGYLPYATDTPAIRQYYNEKLLDIFRRYSSVIAGQFYGHTHRDSLMVLSDKNGKECGLYADLSPHLWSISYIIYLCVM